MPGRKRYAVISAAVVGAMAAGCTSSGSTQASSHLSSGTSTGTSTSTGTNAGTNTNTFQLTVGGGSMEPTLKQGQAIAVTRVPDPYQPHRGDVVVFHDPGGWLSGQSGGGTLIKRVVGLPGDEVQCQGPQGPVIVNGSPLAEPYVAPGDSPCATYIYDVRIPPGDLWVLGDHREISFDSAEHYRMSASTGFVPVRDVVAVYRG